MSESLKSHFQTASNSVFLTW